MGVEEQSGTRRFSLLTALAYTLVVVLLMKYNIIKAPRELLTPREPAPETGSLINSSLSPIHKHSQCIQEL